MVVVAVLNGEGESSCVLEEMELVVFRSCLQRPKSVIFERFVRGYGYGFLKNDEEDDEEKESVERS